MGHAGRKAIKGSQKRERGSVRTKRLKDPKIKWPRRHSAAELRHMSMKSLLRLARDLHVASAEQHRRNMEWDLAWAEIYTRLLKERR